MAGYNFQRNRSADARDARRSSSTDALVRYSPSSEESTPLLSGRTQRKISVLSQDEFKLIGYCLLISVLFLAIGANLMLHWIYCPPWPSTAKAIRRGWEKEVVEHELSREEWRLEEQNHTVFLEKWKLQEAWHEKEVALRIHDEQERQERVREKWAQEAEQHRRVYEETVRHEKQYREIERQKWRHEVEDHDQIVKEREKREEEERKKLNMFWGQVEAHTCTTYATREYTAELMNLPVTWENRVEACKATPLEVHGISYLPKSCEDKGPGIVIGRWDINQHEPDCTPWWNWFKDKDCTSPGSGKRRIEHYLEYLPEGGDWREFCATTPARFLGMEFSGAQECFQYNLGTYGQWEIDDSNCL